ncbi:hypothetical protein WICPIJ_006179 [Wickerhamomyces pijperi]|uniref:Uncharacterized protein n=1 Tax=Wickerhamomyces pijperi TaxID=599730 RepID=A0A9P8Q4G7_WICPI|nr:hypothetical protein WICPIJ_006179 [Wickerhamomyces pijperi]
MFSTLSKVWNDVSEEEKVGIRTTKSINNRRGLQGSSLGSRGSSKSTRFAETVDVRYSNPSSFNDSSFNSRDISSQISAPHKLHDASLPAFQSTHSTIPSMLRERPLRATTVISEDKAKLGSSWNLFGAIGNLFGSKNELKDMKSYMNNMVPTSTISKKHKMETDSKRSNARLDNYNNYGAHQEAMPVRTNNPLLSTEDRPWKRRRLNEPLSTSITHNIERTSLPKPPPPPPSRRIYLKPLPEYRPIPSVRPASTENGISRLNNKEEQVESIISQAPDLLTSSPKKQDQIQEIETFYVMYQKLHDKVKDLTGELKATKEQSATQTSLLESKIKALELKHQSEMLSVKGLINDLKKKLTDKRTPSILPPIQLKHTNQNIPAHSVNRTTDSSTITTPPRSTRARKVLTQTERKSNVIDKENLPFSQRLTNKSTDRKRIETVKVDEVEEDDDDEFDVSLSPAKTDISQYLTR